MRDARPDETGELTSLALASKRLWGYDEEFMARCRDELVVHEGDVREGRVVVSEGADGAREGFYVLLDESEEVALLDMLFVAPEFIGRGVGRRLIEHAQDAARSRGATLMRIESDPFAAGFYERVGARCVGASRSRSTGRDLPLFERML